MPRCVGVLAGWSIVKFFYMGFYYAFFPLKLGHDPTLTKLLFSQFFSPHSRNYDLKSLTQVAYHSSQVVARDGSWEVFLELSSLPPGERRYVGWVFFFFITSFEGRQP